MGFQHWSEVVIHIEAEQLDFNDGKTKISNAQLADDVHLIAQCIPDAYLRNNKMSHQGIALWTHQLAEVKKGTNFVGVPTLHELAEAIRLVSPLPGSKELLTSLHTDQGMLLQLQATYFIAKHLHVTGVEQEPGRRVDIVAKVEDTVLNLHVKNTQPFTKENAQFEAIAFTLQAMRDHPITNSAGEHLVVVKLDGYAPTGLPIAYWEQFASKIQPQDGVQRFEVADPRDPSKLSPITLELVWQRSTDRIDGTLSGINLYQQVGNRLAEISDRIPATHTSIEIALLLNQRARPFQIDRAYFDRSTLDGILLLDILQGAEGWVYERSTIYLRTSLDGVEKELSVLLPERFTSL
jgi:hypothetical protein